MARYLTLLRFTEQGAKELSKSTDRAAVFREAVVKAGARVEAQYWTTGAYDGALIISAEDDTKALQCVAMLATAGNVRTETMKVFDSGEFKRIAVK